MKFASGNWVTGAALGAVFLAGSGTAAWGQTYEIPKQADAKMSDENNVDMLSGIAHFSVEDVAIADLSHTMSSVHNLDGYTNGFYRYGGFDDNFHGGVGSAFQIDNGGAWDYRHSITVGMGGGERFFINPDGSLEATDGGKLTASGAGAIGACGLGGPATIASYTRKDGTEMLMDLTKVRSAGGSNNVIRPGGCGVVAKITNPDGLITRINYKPTVPGSVWARIQSVTRNDGFQLKYTYGPDQYNASGQLTAYGELLSVTGINNAYQACDPMADSCALTGAWPTATYAWSNANTMLTVTDQANRATRFTMDPSGRVVALKPPTSTVDKAAYQYCSRGTYMSPYGGGWITDTTGVSCATVSIQGGASVPIININDVHDRIVRVTEEGRVWDYRFPTGNYGNYYLQFKANRPDGNQSIAISTILGTGALLVFGSPKFAAWFDNDARNRMNKAVVLGRPEETYTYDVRGNVLSNGITSAGYDLTCTNMKTCNKPNWVKDTAGNQTDLTYDPVHGGILTETGPAVIGVRPQKRYTYVQRYAWFKNPAGVMTRSTEPIWKLNTMSFCRTTAASGASCAVAADQVVTTYDYGPDSGPNNLLLRGVVVTADGVSLRTCYRYDQYANKISETQPLANLTSCP